MQKRLRWLASTVFIALACLYLSKILAPSTGVAYQIEAIIGDKTLHFLMGGCVVFTFLSLINARSRLTMLFLGLTVLALFGLDEILQGLHPQRSAEWLDFGYSLAGWLVGLSSYYFFFFAYRR